MNDLKLTNLSMSMFWYKGNNEIVPLVRMVGVKKIVDREDGMATVTFSIHPSAVEFVTGMKTGHVEIRFNAIPLDSPFAGMRFADLTDIVPIQVSVEEITSLDVMEKEMFFIVMAKCRIAWHIFQEINPELSDDWRE